MINLIDEKIDCESVYKKYLDPDYDFKNNSYSALISNHIGFYDALIIYNWHKLRSQFNIDKY